MDFGRKLNINNKKELDKYLYNLKEVFLDLIDEDVSLWEKKNQ